MNRLFTFAALFILSAFADELDDAIDIVSIAFENGEQSEAAKKLGVGVDWDEHQIAEVIDIEKLAENVGKIDLNPARLLGTERY